MVSKLCPSASLETGSEAEERLNKEVNDMNSFDNSTNNLKQTITYFEDENTKSKNN